MRTACLTVLALLTFASSALAQTMPTNPRRVAFTCPDHAIDDGHEIDIRVRATGAVVQTLDLGDPAEVNGEVFADINVQPIAFGQYDLVARAKAGALESANSNAVNFDRVPGAPGGMRIASAIFVQPGIFLARTFTGGRAFRDRGLLRVKGKRLPASTD